MTSGRHYRVWAPHAGRVALHLGHEMLQMAKAQRGWWSVDRDMRHGEMYGYALDGGAPLPDPRSAYQPFGVHGPSECVDHALFAWTDHGWQPPPIAAAVIYEIHLGTFSDAGTFEGAIGRLSHLVDLGVTHVELMPVAEFSGSRGWGYDGVDLFAPHHGYGRPEDLKRLVDACHARGLAVILDVVYKHRLQTAGNYLNRLVPT